MRFEVWAPQADRVTLHCEGTTRTLEHDPERAGWWTGDAEARDGTRYGFALDDGPVLPDPRSRRQPDGPDGLSAVVDPERYGWRTEWAGRPLPGAVLYELHVGTYTPEGTLDAAAERLGHLQELGITHVELMPVCPFPGRHGWGYEGVSLWAVHEPYGGPEALKRFVDRAHELGLGVVLDVVHNHLGPSGNYLPAFGPYFTDTHQTPWGSAVNLDAPGSDEVRAYLVGSALAWLRDYRLDGLRLDAVHALRDSRALHFLEELSTAVDGLAADLGRPLFLVAESDLNDPRLITSREEGGLGLHAQWNDDFHHVLHTALTGEAQGYYADFARAPFASLAKTLTSGFFHDGTYRASAGAPTAARSTVRASRPTACSATPRPTTRSATAPRVTGSRPPSPRAAGLRRRADTHRALHADAVHGRGVGRGHALAVLHGPHRSRARRCRTSGQAPGVRGARVGRGGRPDPQDPATRDRSCLDWSEPEEALHARVLAWYRDLITLRRRQADLSDPDLAAVKIAYDEEARWLALRRGDVRVAVNLSKETAEIPLGIRHARVLAAWEPVRAPGEDGVLSVPGESCVVLRQA